MGLRTQRRSWGLGTLALLLAPWARAASATVTVRNAQLVVLKELRTRAELAEFHRHWSGRQATSRTSVDTQDWSYTIDIVLGQTVDRWLYQSNGLTTKVASSVQRVYQIRQPTGFNSLIGAPRY